MVINEEIYLIRKSKKSYLIFKLDTDKSYNLASWDFLDYKLIRIGFNDKLRF